MKIENNMTMKMKLNPEISCLETQEKFWRGRLREISEKFSEEKQHLQQLLLQIRAENNQLKNDIHNLRNKSLMSTVSCQTSKIICETYVCVYCGKVTAANESISVGINYENYVQKDFENLIQKHDSPKTDSSTLLQQQDRSSVTMNESISYNCEPGESSNNVEKTITKLFPSSDQPESLKIADKLIELYEKRSKLIPEIESYERENLLLTNTLSRTEKNDIVQTDTSDTGYVISSDAEQDSVLVESTSNVVDRGMKNEKSSTHKIFPAVQNIRKKVLKNFSKIKRTCADLKVNNTKLKSCMDTSSRNVIPFDDQEMREEVFMKQHSPSTNEPNEDSSSEKIASSPKCRLISAMKKSKSTGNIVKKVAFLDDLPTSKTVSESNLLEIDDYRSGSTSELNSHIVTSGFVHHNKTTGPVPAPRSKKNIIISSI